MWSSYSKLSSMSEMQKSKNFKPQIESATWEQNEWTAAVNFEKTLIVSHVMRAGGIKTFL